MTALLSVTGLSAGYGGSEVLGDVSFEVERGEVVCLLGANGAGKTTAMSVITGLLNAAAGSMRFDGRDLLAMRPHQRVAAGISLCPEGRQVFPNLTVEENLLLGSFHRAARAGRAERLGQAYALFPQLADRRRQLAGSLSGGEQQMLAISRALMAGPRLLLLDEPSLGLSPKMVLTVFEAIRAIARSAISILLVEQNTQAALSVATRGYVLRGGRIVHADTRAGLRESRIVQDAFFGRGRPMRADADA
jgi:branched-chain amino acid transport system ATP-binding protein